MNNIFKGKAGTIIILLFTVILAGVAIFTAIRLYQLRSQPVAPNVPSSIPRAGGICGGLQGRVCPAGEKCIYSNGSSHPPSPDATGTCQSEATRETNADAAAASCSLSFTLAVSTPTPTPTPVPLCNSVCTTSAQCSTGLICNIATGATTGNCRNASCLANSNCICTTATPTPTPTPTPTTTTNVCNGTCTTNANCNSGHVCSSGFCRNPSCVTSTSCTCSGTPGPTATPAPTLPQSGTDWPTLVGFGVGILVILGSLLLAL